MKMNTHQENLDFKFIEQINQSKVLNNISNALSIFGSARTNDNSYYFKDAYNLAKIAALHDVPVISGGGPGIMKAANMGAFENGGVSVGLNIELPNEQHANQYQTYSLYYKHFPPRKMAFIAHSKCFAVYPGGFGTLDELFEVLTLVQTKKTEHKPVVLVGKEFWTPLSEWINNQLKKNKMISEEDVDLFNIVSNSQDAWTFLYENTK